jgi:hypothetical protein
VKVGLVQLGNRWTWVYYDPAFPDRRVRVAQVVSDIYRLTDRTFHNERMVKGNLFDVCVTAADMINPTVVKTKGAPPRRRANSEDQPK